MSDDLDLAYIRDAVERGKPVSARRLRPLLAAYDRERELVGEITRDCQRLGRELAELRELIERAETARKAWTEIGARAEARLVALQLAVLGLCDDPLYADGPVAHVWRTDIDHLRAAAMSAATATPLLAAAQRLVRAWDRLCDCVNEFEPEYPEACGEYQQALDDTIAALKELLEGPSATNAVEMSPPGLVTDQEGHERLNTEGGES